MRSGKDSRIGAPFACYQAVFGGHEKHLGRGERGVIGIWCQDQAAADLTHDYVRAYLEGSPVCAALIEEIRSGEIVLGNRITVRSFPCTRSAPRNWSFCAAVVNEPAFFPLEGQADSDVEIMAAIRRGTIAFPAARILKMSSPWLKAGVMWDDHERSFGRDDLDLLALRGTSAFLNPAIDAGRLAQAQRRDPERFSREFEAVFSDDSSAWLPGQAISDAIAHGRFELPPQPDVPYVGAVDTCGGVAGEDRDKFTFRIVHAVGQGAEQRIVDDVARGWGATRTVALNLEHVVEEIAALCRAYNITVLYGDKYASSWVTEAMARAGLAYRNPDLDRSGIYLQAAPWFSQGRVRLLDHEPTVKELRALQRKLKSGGREVVDHPQAGGHHDDFANVCCLGIVQAAALAAVPDFSTLEVALLPMGARPSVYGPATLPPALGDEGLIDVGGGVYVGEDEDEDGAPFRDDLTFTVRRRNRYGY